MKKIMINKSKCNRIDKESARRLIYSLPLCLYQKIFYLSFAGESLSVGHIAAILLKVYSQEVVFHEESSALAEATGIFLIK